MSTFRVDDLIFSKVRGHPPWPSRVTSVEDGRCKVFFFGTYEVATVKNADIFAYNSENLQKFKSNNKKYYQIGLKEIKQESEVQDLQTDGLVNSSLNIDGQKETLANSPILSQHTEEAKSPDFLYVTSEGDLTALRPLAMLEDFAFDEKGGHLILANDSAMIDFSNKTGFSVINDLTDTLVPESKMVEMAESTGVKLNKMFLVVENSLPYLANIKVPLDARKINLLQEIPQDMLEPLGLPEDLDVQKNVESFKKKSNLVDNQKKKTDCDKKNEKTLVKTVTNGNESNNAESGKRKSMNTDIDGKESNTDLLKKTLNVDLSDNLIMKTNYAKNHDKISVNSATNENESNNAEPVKKKSMNTDNDRKESNNTDSHKKTVNVEAPLRDVTNTHQQQSNRVDKRNVNLSSETFVQLQKPAATLSSNISHWNDLVQYIQEVKGEKRDFKTLTEMELTDHVIFYFQTVLKKDQSMYNASCYKTKINAIKRQMKVLKIPPFSPSNNDKIQEVISERQRQSTAAGETRGKHRAYPFTREQIATIRSKGLLCQDNPQGLRNVVFFNFNVKWGLRARAELYDATMDDIIEGPIDDNGLPEYLSLSKRIRKNMQGQGGNTGAEDYDPKLWPDNETPEMCGVRAWMFYKSKKNPKVRFGNAPLFHNCITMKPENYASALIWYSNARSGKQFLGSIFKEMAAKCGIDTVKHHIKGTTGRKLALNTLSTKANANPVFVAKHGGQRNVGTPMQYTSLNDEIGEALGGCLSSAISGLKVNQFSNELEKVHDKTDKNVDKILEVKENPAVTLNPYLKRENLKRSRSRSNSCRKATKIKTDYSESRSDSRSSRDESRSSSNDRKRKKKKIRKRSRSRSFAHDKKGKQKKSRKYYKRNSRSRSSSSDCKRKYKKSSYRRENSTSSSDSKRKYKKSSKYRERSSSSEIKRKRKSSKRKVRSKSRSSSSDNQSGRSSSYDYKRKNKKLKKRSRRTRSRSPSSDSNRKYKKSSKYRHRSSSSDTKRKYKKSFQEQRKSRHSSSSSDKQGNHGKSYKNKERSRSRSSSDVKSKKVFKGEKRSRSTSYSREFERKSSKSEPQFGAEAVEKSSSRSFPGRQSRELMGSEKGYVNNQIGPSSSSFRGPECSRLNQATSPNEMTQYVLQDISYSRETSATDATGSMESLRYNQFHHQQYSSMMPILNPGTDLANQMGNQNSENTDGAVKSFYPWWDHINP